MNDLTDQLKDILAECATSKCIAPETLYKLRAQSFGGENLNPLIALATLSSRYPPASHSVRLIMNFLIEQHTQTTEPLCSKIIKNITQSPQAKSVFIDTLIQVSEQLKLSTPTMLFTSLSTADLSEVVERLFQKKYYGLIIKIPALDSRQSFNILFRAAQSYGALNRSYEAIKIIETLEGSKLTKPQAQSVTLLEATLHHRAGDNEHAIALLENAPKGPKTAMLAAAEYGYRHYSPDPNLARIKDSMKSWDRNRNRFEASAHPAASTNSIMRIGFISHNFKIHPVGWMSAGLFTQIGHDKSSEFEYFFYDCAPGSDFIAKTLRKNRCNWRDLQGAGTKNRLKQIRADNLDVLIDLDGLTANSAFEVVCEKPARHIGKWIGGLVGSTFNDNIDFLISDKYHSPESHHQLYIEQLIRLKNGYSTFTPPPYKFFKRPAPFHKNGYITFGCFNNAAKLSNKCIQTWVAILNGTPGSRLLLKDKHLDDPFAIALLKRKWLENGGQPTQLIFSGPSSHEDHLNELQQRVDICLDPMPYSGGLSTLEAIFLGIPVITIPGDLLCHRHSFAYLSIVGCGEFIAPDISSYIEIAQSLGKDIARIDTYRESLRQQLLQSPLLDHKGFKSDFENKITLMVRDH